MVDLMMKVSGRTFDKTHMVKDFKQQASMMTVKVWSHKVVVQKIAHGKVAVLSVVAHFARPNNGKSSRWALS